MQIGMYELLCKAQEMIARKYPTILTDKSKRGEIKNYIAQFLYDTGYTVVGYSMKQVTDRLFCEMAEYSFLTAYLNDPNIEEININGWDDVALTYLDGHIEKSDEQFFSPGHAVDIIKRLLLHSGVTIDNAVPRAEGHLPNNTRITVIKTPIVDEDRGIAASIRMLHPQRVDRENLIRTESITDEMLSFLEMCVCYGVSYVVAGRTSSGKTTLLNSLLGSLPDYKRIYTIENGARELSLIKRDVSGRIKIMWCTPCQDLPTKRNQISHRKTLWLLPCDLTRISYVSVRCEIAKQALLLKRAPQTTPLYRRFMAMADARHIKELRFLRKRKRRKMTWVS